MPSTADGGHLPKALLLTVKVSGCYRRCARLRVKFKSSLNAEESSWVISGAVTLAFFSCLEAELFIAALRLRCAKLQMNTWLLISEGVKLGQSAACRIGPHFVDAAAQSWRVLLCLNDALRQDY